MQLVITRLKNHIQDATHAAAVLRRVIGTHHFELFNRIHRRKYRNAAKAGHRRVRRAHAIDQRIHLTRPRSIHRIAHVAIVVAHRTRYSRRQKDQRVYVARVQRQVHNSLIVYNFANRRRCSFQQRSIGRHRNRFRHIAYRQHDVDSRLLLDLQRNSILQELFEAARARFHAVQPGLQKRRGVIARIVGTDLRTRIRADIDNCDGGPGHTRSRGIFYRT